MDDLSKKHYYIDFFGLCSIGVLSLGYVEFVRGFAEQHIQFPFLNFPIFVGEILLFLCFALFVVKYRYKGHLKHFTSWHYLIFFYLVFVILKAIHGYFTHGPLALRHAALFYYPAFAVFGYSFFRKELFNQIERLLKGWKIIALGYLQLPSPSSHLS